MKEFEDATSPEPAERYEKNSDSELIDQFGDGNPIEVENDTANRAGYIMGWLRGATEAVVS